MYSFKLRRRLSFLKFLKKPTPMLVVIVLILWLGVTGESHPGAQELTSGVQSAPKTTGPPLPEPNAESWVLADTDSGLYLVGDNPDEQLPIGSITKIMTALEILNEGVDPDQELTVPKGAEDYVGDVYSNVGLIAGERLSVRDLLEATLIPSGTDAAYTLEEDLGDGNVDNFVRKMNDRAALMGLKNTHFEAPAGLDTPANYSSARDLATLTQAAMKYPLFVEIVATKDATISTQNRHIQIHNTNQLLSSYPKAIGVKTGTTSDAGPNLVASAKDGDASYTAVVLDDGEDPERFEDARSILDYAFSNYQFQPVVKQGEVYGEAQLPYRRGATVKLAAEEDVAAPVSSRTQVKRQVTTKEIPSKAEAGQELGQVEVFVDGQSAGSSPVYAQEGYEEASLFDKAWYYSLGWLWYKASQLL